MSEIPRLVDNKVLRPAETVLALKILGEIELLRLKTVARLYGRELPPDVTWEDLLQETLTQGMVRARDRPEGMEMVTFLAGIMRDLKAEHWVRALKGRRSNRELGIDTTSNDSGKVALRKRALDSRGSPKARRALREIKTLFGGDGNNAVIVAAWLAGQSAEQICRASGLTDSEYDSARKRIRRILLREGLTSEPKLGIASPVGEFTRLLEVLVQELIQASDGEIIQAAKDLGMDPRMRASAAFIGLRFPVEGDVSDFFDVEAYNKFKMEQARDANTMARAPALAADKSLNHRKRIARKPQK
jgi:RNA polymerase sigma-70 factor (ECF subfamily)